MRSKEKIVIVILVIVTLIMLSILIVKQRGNPKEKIQENTQENEVEKYTEVIDNGIKVNTSSKLKQTKRLENLEIGNIQLTNQNEQSVLLANVTNKGDKKTQRMLVDIILYNESGEEIATITGIISPLDVGQSTQLNTVVQEDYTNAYDFEIVKKQ